MIVKFGSTDFGPYVAEVKEKSPDAVLPDPAGARSGGVSQRGRAAGPGRPVYAYAPPATGALISWPGRTPKGFRAVSLTRPPTSDDPAVVEYREAMEKYAPKQEPDFYSIANFAWAKAFAEIVRTIDGEVDKESITKAIESASESRPASRRPCRSARGHLGTHEVMRVEVKNGEFVSVGDFVAP